MKRVVLRFTLIIFSVLLVQTVDAQTYDYYPVGNEIVNGEEGPITDSRTYRIVFDNNGCTFYKIDNDGIAKWPIRLELVRNDSNGRVYQRRDSIGCVETMSFTPDLSEMYKNYTCPNANPVSRTYKRK